MEVSLAEAVDRQMEAVKLLEWQQKKVRCNYWLILMANFPFWEYYLRLFLIFKLFLYIQLNDSMERLQDLRDIDEESGLDVDAIENEDDGCEYTGEIYRKIFNEDD